MMRLLLVLLLLPAQPAPDARFAAGNARFDSGDYAGARETYLQVIDGGHASAALYFNLADTYYRLDSLGQAVRYLEKARMLAPDDPRVAHNLRIVRDELNLAVRPAPRPYWEAGWAWLHRNVPPVLFFGLGLAFFLTALGLAAWRTWADSRNPWLRRGLLLLLPPAILLIALALALSADVGTVLRAVVLKPVELQDRTGDARERLSEGHVVRVVGQTPGRVEIETPGGARGWVAADALGEI